jgi:hypothetical protein
MTDFVDDLETELLKAARRRQVRRRRFTPPRVAARPALVLAAALAAFAFVVRIGPPDPERPATRAPAGLPVAGVPTPCNGKAPVPESAPERVVRELAVLRRPRSVADRVDVSRLPIEGFDPEGARRVGPLAVVPARGVCRRNAPPPERIHPPRGKPKTPTVEEANEIIARAREGACVVYREQAARCFTLGEIRAGKAFALVVERDGARIIGLVPDGTQRVTGSADGGALALEVEENTVDTLLMGLKPTDEVSLKLGRGRMR